MFAWSDRHSFIISRTCEIVNKTKIATRDCDRWRNWPQNPHCAWTLSALLCDRMEWISPPLEIELSAWPALVNGAEAQCIQAEAWKHLCFWACPLSWSWNPEIAGWKSPSYPVGSGGTVWREPRHLCRQPTSCQGSEWDHLSSRQQLISQPTPDALESPAEIRPEGTSLQPTVL